MIIGQTPFRISFFGGGTDWPEFFRVHGGAVLGGTIDQYLYHCTTRFPSRLFDDACQAKRQLAPPVSNPEIDQLYDRARAAGALGGKLLGAGGGGSLLLFVPAERQPALRRALADRADVTVRFNSHGSRIIHP